MLTSLLPGLRQVRGPTVAGALLLCTVYFNSYDPDRDLETTVGTPAMALVDFMGRVGSLTTLAVVAYVLGALFLAVISELVRRFNHQIVKSFVMDDGTLTIQSSPVILLILRRVFPFTSHALFLVGEVAQREGVRAEQVATEVQYLGGRLMVASHDLWIEYDRLRSEAEFRVAIGLPLLPATASFLGQASLDSRLDAYCLGAATLIAAALVYNSFMLNRSANEILARSLADGLVSTLRIDLAREKRESPVTHVSQSKLTGAEGAQSDNECDRLS